METLTSQGKSLPIVALRRPNRGKWLEDFNLFQIARHRKQSAKDIQRSAANATYTVNLLHSFF